ncbi:MAG: hypothetical protein R3E13_02040 [Alphaproteobacteria bacterium]
MNNSKEYEKTIPVTVFTSSKKRTLSKTISLDKDGNIQKATGGQLTAGRIKIKKFTNVTEVATFMSGLKSNQAVSFGIPKEKAEIVLSQKRLKTYTGDEMAISRTNDNFSWPEGMGVLTLDYDPHPGEEPMTSGEFVSTLRGVVPELEHVTIAVKPSTSSCIYQGKKEVSGIKGLHAFMVCGDASRIPEIGKLIYDRLWLAGYGYIRMQEAAICSKEVLSIQP